MLDSEGFVSAGWVHNLALHSFQSHSQKKYLVRAKVITRLFFKLITKRIMIIGQSFPKTMGGS